MAETSDVEGGIKKLTLDNWLELDPILLAFGRIGPEGRSHPVDKEQRAKEFLAIELSPRVPADIQTMFRTGRAALLYGYFYYPLYALGLGELARIAESALHKHIKGIGGPHKRTFQKQLEWMLEQEHFTQRQFEIWEGFRAHRNFASHPEYQMVGPPGEARHRAQVMAHAISCLFDPSLDFDSFWRISQ